MQNKMKNDMEVEGAYAELLTPQSEVPQVSIHAERRKKKRELKNKAALENLENLCMLNGERRKIIPRRLDMDALDDTNDETESMWRYDLHGMVVIADATKRVIDSWDNNRGANNNCLNNCLRQVRFNDSERQTKAKDKMKDMERKRERDRKDLRVRFYERNA